MADFDVLHVGFKLALIHSRAHLYTRFETKTHFEVARRFTERGGELVANCLFHNDTAAGRTRLPGDAETTRHRQLDRGGDVGVVEDNHGILAAHLQLYAGEVLHRLLVDLAPHEDGTGEADAVHVFAAHQCVAHAAPRPGDVVDHALGDARLHQRFDQQQADVGRQRRRFEDDGVAVDQRRGHLPRRNGHGEVPRRHQSHDTQGFAPGVEQLAGGVAGQRLPAHPPAFAAVIAEDVAGAGHLAFGLGEGFAFLAGEGFGEFVHAIFDDAAGLV